MVVMITGVVYKLSSSFFVSDLSPKTCTTMECVKTSASLLNAMDLSADPVFFCHLFYSLENSNGDFEYLFGLRQCEDFFQFACGTWVKKHVIPEDRSSLSTFEVMADDLQIILKGEHILK